MGLHIGYKCKCQQNLATGGMAQPSYSLNIDPGYSLVVDSEIGPYTNHNAQSIILQAPQIGSSQSHFSAFLNNGYTNAPSGELLQNGLLFDGEYGSVVWTDEAHGLSPVSCAINYLVGHDYYFTISYTNSLWWLCVSDRTIGSSTYQCRSSPNTDGNKLWGGGNTSVWFENQNSNFNWYQGFTNPVIAFSARNYVNGTSSNWSTEGQETTWCGNDLPDPTGSSGAISGTLVNDGRAEFHLHRVPLLCP